MADATVRGLTASEPLFMRVFRLEAGKKSIETDLRLDLRVLQVHDDEKGVTKAKARRKWKERGMMGMMGKTGKK